jgi:hypothetical protein
VQTFSTSERQAFVWGAAACTHTFPRAAPSTRAIFRNSN